MITPDITETVARLRNAAEDAERETSKAIRDYPEALREAADIIETLAAERDALRAELADGSFYKEADIDAMQDTIAALRADNDRLRGDRNEFASYVVEFSELAASVVEEMSKKPDTTWGQVKAAIRALGDLGDRRAYHAKQHARAALDAKP